MRIFILICSALCAFSSFSASAAFINFNDYTINSYGGGNQDLAGTAVVSPDGSTLTLTGNLWKSISDTFTVTTDTILKFEFFSSSEPEIAGIGFTDTAFSNSSRTFEVAGRHVFGIQTFNTYDAGDGWVSFSINVGDFYTGVFDRLFFIEDDDSSLTTSNAAFRNIEICEEGTCFSDFPSAEVSAPESSSIALLGLGLIGLVSIRHRFC